jgi:hypothetical protein
MGAGDHRSNMDSSRSADSLVRLKVAQAGDTRAKLSALLRHCKIR